MYRERFAGMYSSWAYSLAQVHFHLNLFNPFDPNDLAFSLNYKFIPFDRQTRPKPLSKLLINIVFFGLSLLSFPSRFLKRVC